MKGVTDCSVEDEDMKKDKFVSEDGDSDCCNMAIKDRQEKVKQGEINIILRGWKDKEEDEEEVGDR